MSVLSKDVPASASAQKFDQKFEEVLKELAELKEAENHICKMLLSNRLRQFKLRSTIGVTEKNPAFKRPPDEIDTLNFLRDVPGFDLAAVSIAKRYPTIGALSKASYHDLCRVHRVGDTKAMMILAYLDLYGIKIRPPR